MDNQLDGRWISEAGEFMQKSYTDALLCAASPQMWLQKQNNMGAFPVHYSGIVSSVAIETEFSKTVQTQ